MHERKRYDSLVQHCGNNGEYSTRYFRNSVLDWFRLLAAALVVAIHTSPLTTFSEDADFFLTRVLARVAVPFFFMVTGQFVVSGFWNAGTRRVMRYVKKTALLYGTAILLYLPVGMYAGHYEKIRFTDALRMLVFDGTFYHLWYFPACIVGILLVYLMSRMFPRRQMLIAAAVLYGIGIFGDSYYGLIENIPVLVDIYEAGFSVFSYTRNGILMAPLFLLLGVQAGGSRPCDRRILWAGLGISFAAMTEEAFLLRHFEVPRHDSMYVLLPAVMFFLYRILLFSGKQETAAAERNILDGQVFVTGENPARKRGSDAKSAGLLKYAVTASAWIYILHPAMIIVVRGAAKALKMKLLTENSLIHYAAVLVLSAAVSLFPAVFQNHEIGSRLKRNISMQKRKSSRKKRENGRPERESIRQKRENGRQERGNSRLERESIRQERENGRPEGESSRLERENSRPEGESNRQERGNGRLERGNSRLERENGRPERGNGRLRRRKGGQRRRKIRQKKLQDFDREQDAEAFCRGRAWLELDRGALRQNVDALQKRLPDSCQLMPAVKADAYGHGAVLIAKELQKAGVNAFCVACAQEGAELRRKGVRGVILVLGYTHPEQFPLLWKYHLTQTVIDRVYAGQLNRCGRTIHVHIGIDTGMHRLGVRSEQLEQVLEIYGMEHLAVDGLFTHLCTSDAMTVRSRNYTGAQAEAFYRLLAQLQERGYPCPKIHMQASYGVLNYPKLAGDYARVGIALYGVLSTKEDTMKWQNALKPVLSLKTRIATVKTLYQGESAGYGIQFTAAQDMQIATLAIGYADGLPRTLSSGVGSVLIHGCRAPVIGRICMDQTTVDISGIPDVRAGDEAVLIGHSGDLEISVCDIARQAGTITNEILSRMGARLERVVV